MLDTYDNLIQTIIKWSHRKDILDMIPDFIKLAEYEMFNNAETQLRIREFETVSTTATTGEYLELPPNFEKARSVLIDFNGWNEVKFRTPQELPRQPANGMPRFFTVVGNELQFDRVPDSDYNIQIQYYKKPDALSESNQTNIVLTDYPNIYLYATLHQVHMWSQDFQEAAVYAGKMQDEIKGANKADKKARYGPAPSMHVEGYTP